MGGAHQPVLLEETVSAWLTDINGRYVDGTFGRGGHSSLLLERLDRGELLALDKDPEAVACANGLARQHTGLHVHHSAFADMASVVRSLGWQGKVAGILVDLGVSSPQLDDAVRGFSFMQDGPLDMRMDTSRGESAAEWLARAGHGEIASALKRFGEERFAGRIASAIVETREISAIDTTAKLVAIIEAAVPKKEQGKHKATRSFQAIRMVVNRELEELEVMLSDAMGLLAPGGRLAVISFHSLEDRMVKRYMRNLEKGNAPPRQLPVLEKDIQRYGRIVVKAQKPSAAEIERNPRSRSAILRVVEKL